MKNWFVLLLIGLSVNVNAQVITSLDEYFNHADKFLAKHVDEGLVDYSGIKDKPEQLIFLIKYMEQADLSNAAVSTKKAFWINAYNLTVIKSIINKYPIASPIDNSGFFESEKHLVAGQQLTLDGIEKGVLKNIDADPRMHFVLVCAAIGCPKLANFAYRPNELDKQLEARTKVILNEAGFIRIDEAKKKVKLSEIFNWYKADFTQNGQSVISYINTYRDNKIDADCKTSYYNYNWDLNEKKKD